LRSPVPTRNRGASAHVAGVAERVASGLRPNRKDGRLLADRYRLQRAPRRVEHVDDVVVASRKPELRAVGADVAHVGAPAAGDGPRDVDLARGEIDDRHAALPVRGPVDPVRSAVGYVELPAIATRIQSVRSLAGRDESDLRERIAVDDEHAVRHHVGYVEHLAVRTDANVLRRAALRDLQVADYGPRDEVDLDQAAGEFAREDRVTAVDREIRMIDAAALARRDRRLQRHRRRVAEIEALVRFGNDDRRASIRREIHVVRVVDGNRLAGLPG